MTARKIPQSHANRLYAIGRTALKHPSSRRGNSSFVRLYSHPDKDKWMKVNHLGVQCAAPLNYNPDVPPGYECEYVLNILQTAYREVGGDLYKSIPEKVVRKYLSWLTKESAYADAFLRKNPGKIMEIGAIMDTRVPSNLMVGGMIAMRYLTEEPERVLAWDSLTRKGVGRGMAFLACQVFTERSSEYVVSDYGGHACCINGRTLDKEVAKNFLEGKVLHPTLPYKHTGTYSTIVTLFGGGSGLKSFLQMDLKKKQVKVGSIFGIQDWMSCICSKDLVASLKKHEKELMNG